MKAVSDAEKKADPASRAMMIYNSELIGASVVYNAKTDKGRSFTNRPKNSSFYLQYFFDGLDQLNLWKGTGCHLGLFTHGNEED